MDITTWAGFAAVAGMIALGVRAGDLPVAFLNWHGLAIVVGGTLAAMLINTPLQGLREAAGALFSLLRSAPYPSRAEITASVAALAEAAHARGRAALQEADARAVGGYLARAATTAVEYNDADLVAAMLETEINTDFDRKNETANVFRTMSVLAPMFGLLGTLIGIVSVLRELSNPDQVGRSMGLAMTTAFYGIVLANVFCVPVAGKLRARNILELRARGMVADGIVMILRGSVPAAIERKLASYR